MTNATTETAALLDSLTPASLALFNVIARDAGNWSGEPLVGGNFTLTAADKGNLTDLKVKGFVVTFRSDGHDWIGFTAKGIALAASFGLRGVDNWPVH
jgi:hypothetical protein